MSTRLRLPGNRRFLCCVLALLAITGCGIQGDTDVAWESVTNTVVASPGKGPSISARWNDTSMGAGMPALVVQSADGSQRMEVNLALQMRGVPEAGSLRALRMLRLRRDETWNPVYGEQSQYRDAFQGLRIDFAGEETDPPLLALELRAYEEGVAWRYVFLRGAEGAQNAAKVSIDAEDTTFRFPEGSLGWATYRAQATYERVPLAEIKDGCERPLTIEFPDGSFGALAEAGMDDFARMKVGAVRDDGERQPVLRSILDSPVAIDAPYAAPWRVLLLGDGPGQLLERNGLLLTLNEPSKIADSRWIRPGKVMREVTLSTSGGKALVDFAVAHNIQFIEYDAGWYGHEYDEAQDARTVTPDPDRTSKVPNWSGLNLPEVIGYAAQKGVGVILYVNRRHLEKQLDELLPLYKSWGVAGLKYGFVNVGSQEWSRWLHDAVRKAAAHELMVDIHDEYRPTGLSRTWPNLMTQEGILGNEAMPDATHNVTLPFTRGLAGAGDYTICYYTPRIKTTHPHQLALAVIMYSPWQFVFWYDKPGDYQGEPEMRFFEQLPTVWNESRVLLGEIGQYISIARRHGDTWWLATANNTQARTLEVPLQFLDSGRRYVMDLYEEPAPHNETAERSSRTNVAVWSCLLEGRGPLRLDLPASGGHAAVLRPVATGASGLPARCNFGSH
ncbi:MAG: glycoside hydrolase family 97 catalytic domain-containing protein [Bryobacterales bacterium]|nr:glycoside hydrolase family 97 catalytic domain-containing protein [Bryobacterales bacterium]